MTEIDRPTYLRLVEPYIGKDLIKVFTGQRRVGKSSLMRLVQKRILELSPKSNFIIIDLEDYQFSNIKTDSDLMKYVKTLQHKKNNILFIDEIQEIEHFEKAVRSLNATGLFDIYLTGSNANLLSRELSTLLAGRCIEIEVYALSYTEFLEFHNRESNTSSLQEYMKFGGLPYLRNLELKDEIVFDYLKNISQSILYRDIVNRHHIRNTDLLEKVILYLADNIGSLVSAKKISDKLNSHHIKTSPKSILEMIHHLTEACFLHRVKRFEIKGRKIFESNDKYYFEDLGIRNSLIGIRPNDINQWMENVVYHHLKIWGYKVYVGKDREREIDFVAEKDGQTRYYQVAYLLPNKKVIDREFGNLLKITDQYPKTVISLDSMAIGEIQGIPQQNLLDFLTKSPNPI